MIYYIKHLNILSCELAEKYIKDLYSFFEEQKELNYFNLNLVMAIFDVGSLFTNIPLQEAISVYAQKLFEDKNYIDGFFKDFCCEMLSIAMAELFTLINKEYYRQDNGVVMGSPLGPNFANIFLLSARNPLVGKCPPV